MTEADQSAHRMLGVEVEALGDRRRDISNGEPAPVHVPVLLELIDHVLGSVGGNGEPNPDGSARG